MLRYLLIFLCFLPLLLFRDFTPNNELKYLSIADEAIREGHFFTFYNHGIPYTDKPPLYFWIIMAGKELLGKHYMFFIDLFSLIPALLILFIMNKWIKNYVPANIRFSGQLMLITSGLFTGSAIVLRMDMLMCLFIILALFTFYKIYENNHQKSDTFLLPIYIFLAIFTKGPVGLLVPFLSIIIFLIIKRKIRHFGRYLGWKQTGILLFLCGIWFTGVYLEGGSTYLNDLLFHQTVNRAIDSSWHKQPFWYYFKTIGYSLAPWTLFYLAVILTGLKNKLMNTDLKKFFLTIILSTLTALSLSSSKLDIYMLPIFPFITYLSILLLPAAKNIFIKISIVIPAVLLCLSFPGYFIIREHIDLPVQYSINIPAALLLLSLFSGLTLYFVIRKKLFQATNSLAIGLLLTILTSSLSISGLNQYIGFKKICQKAKTIAANNNIKNYYFYPFRSGENLDVYLNQEIIAADLNRISSLIDKQKFILFVKNKTLKKTAALQTITNNYISYTIGDYSIIEFY